MKVYVAIAIVAVFLVFQSSATNASQNLQKQQATLNMISEFAIKFCQTSPITSSRMELNAEGKIQLSKFLKKLFGTDIEAAGDVKVSEATGVLQRDLAGVIANSNECRIELWRWLRKLVEVGDKVSDNILPQPRKAQLGKTLELGREGVVRRLMGGLEGMSKPDIAQYLIGAIPKIAGGVTCDELQELLTPTYRHSRVNVVEQAAPYVRRPFSENCFRGISEWVGRHNARRALEALQNSRPMY